MLVAKNLHFIAFVRVESTVTHECIQGDSPKDLFELVSTGTAAVKQNISGWTINLCGCKMRHREWVRGGEEEVLHELKNSFVIE